MKKQFIKFDNFNKALKRLNEGNIEYKRNNGNEIYQDALIKRFEFTYELAWKTLREVLLSEGYSLAALSPRGVLKSAYEAGFLANEEVWLDMLEARNLTAHDYGRELSAEVAEKISNRFCKELSNLAGLLSERLK